MAEGIGRGEVVLAQGAPASELLYEILKGAVEAFPDVFAGLILGASVGEFRSRYADVLPWFEAARADSPYRRDIARFLAHETLDRVSWRSGDTEVPLVEHLGEPSTPFELVTVALGTPGPLYPRVKRQGDTLEGADLRAFAAGLVRDGLSSESVAAGIDWVATKAEPNGLDLRDRRIVVLGASAELAPTRLFLEGGAEVLWIDIRPPSDEFLRSEELSGSLHWVAEGANLLTQPGRIRATIEGFAAGRAVDLGLYAYAPGQTREWRLTASMNAIVDTLPPAVVRTITMLVSPTTCGVLSESDLKREVHRIDERPAWQGFLKRVGGLGRGSGHARVGETCTNRGIVPTQGTSYAAAQYLGKLIAAEAWVIGDASHHVSANTAGVSRTASMSHPVFDTAFAGADAFGVETYEPETTANLNGLLAIRDWLDPRSTNERPTSMSRAITSTRVHGGIYSLPYPLDRALRVAAALGAMRDPRRIGPMLRR